MNSYFIKITSKEWTYVHLKIEGEKTPKLFETSGIALASIFNKKHAEEIIKESGREDLEIVPSNEEAVLFKESMISKKKK